MVSLNVSVIVCLCLIPVVAGLSLQDKYDNQIKRACEDQPEKKGEDFNCKEYVKTVGVAACQTLHKNHVADVCCKTCLDKIISHFSGILGKMVNTGKQGK